MLESYLSENIGRGLITSLVIILIYAITWTKITAEERVLKIDYPLGLFSSKTFLWESIVDCRANRYGSLYLYFQYDKPVHLICTGVDSEKVKSYIYQKLEEKKEKVNKRTQVI